MSVPHGAPFASGAYPHVPMGEPIGEPIGETGEGIGATLAAITERLAVVAVAARIMERRAPRDCYARSIARETRALAVEMREALHRVHAGEPIELAPRIVDAAPAPSSSPTDTAPDTASDGEHIGELCPFPGCCHFYNDPCADCLEVERGADRDTAPAPSSATRRPRGGAPRGSSRRTGGAQ